MPELPEVEITCRGIAPHLVGQMIQAVAIHNPALRTTVPAIIAARLPGMIIQTVARRGKFILIDCRNQQTHGTLLIHLGMSGTLRLFDRDALRRQHDHVEIILADKILRYNDPRRFGALLWHGEHDGPLAKNIHLSKLGVEPFSREFSARHAGKLLFDATRGRKLAIKPLLLAGTIVVGVGNIYACESLFHARLHPETPVGEITLAQYQRLATAIRKTLKSAIEKGGSSLRDFVDSAGQVGYFQQEYFVYGRKGLPCRACQTPIHMVRQGQRSSFFCDCCQKNR